MHVGPVGIRDEGLERRVRHKVTHLDERKRMALVKHCSSHEPGFPRSYVGLSASAREVEVLHDAPLDAQETLIAAIDDDHGNARSLPMARKRGKSGTGGPEPETVSLGGYRRLQADR